MHLAYERYLDQVLGGWIGKCLGGAAGTPYEGDKSWIETMPDPLLPTPVPANDDLDLQVLWLKVLEEKGAAMTSDDLAAAWMEGCWYTWNEYGIFRRNWQLGIHPPASGRFGNQFWETCMGCPIRSELWGYIFPGAPDLAAHYAALDGVLDHTEEATGAEMMLAAMASMAFFIPDVRRLAEMFAHYVPHRTATARLISAAFESFDAGLSLRQARDRMMVLAGHPEVTETRVNVPFTLLGLLYGNNDLEQSILAALRCGYDTDCTMATAGAFIGQILGASRIPERLRSAVGDQLVMGIEYRRPEMTISALARDTARMGVLLADQLRTGICMDDAPPMAPLPATARPLAARLTVEYDGRPAAAPGDTLIVRLRIEGEVARNTPLTIQTPPGWNAAPDTCAIHSTPATVTVALHADADARWWPMRHLFTAHLATQPAVSYTFGVAGAGLYQFLGVYYDALPDPHDSVQQQRRYRHHFVSLQRPYLPEPEMDVEATARQWAATLRSSTVVPSHEYEIDPGHLVGLHGACCIYLARTILCPEERSVYIVVGNNDAYRIYLNGELVAEVDESTWWTPFNNAHRVRLRHGENRLLLKLLKRGEQLRFTLGLRTGGVERSYRPGPPIDADDWLADQNEGDWLVDLADANPLARDLDGG